jgi:gliding motility-associated-like protein
MKKYLLVAWLAIFALPLAATHIVGGEINYRCLGNDQYEIKLTVYRDCYNGVPYFDNPACIGIFDQNHVLLDTLMTYVRNDDTLSIFLDDPCIIIPPDICYHTTTYVDTAYLPFRPGGYQIVYQRCCRNWTINNLINPGNVGMTYYTFLSEAALLGCNSNPVFTNWPSPLICNNVPILFDHSAVDAEGDLLVYELCSPLDGALYNDPMPQPPFAPPYNSVPWLAPYGPANMLGGNPALAIDPVTGLLTGTPAVVGQFVVGVCVSEYRNGQLISVTRRDFQYNVRNCSTQNQAAFFAPEVVCDSSLTVQFNNQSQSIGNGFLWDFGDPSTLNDTSTLVQPTWIYPDTGTYTITLIAGPGSLCADTFVSTVNVQYTTLVGAIDYEVLSCGGDSIVVQFYDLSADPVSVPVQWYWDFGTGGATSTEPDPTFAYDSSGTYNVFFGVLAANGCFDILTVPVSIQLPAPANAINEYYLCPPSLGGSTNVVLNPGGNPDLQYAWSPANFLDNPSSPSPVASPPVTTTYTVTVTAVNLGRDTCEQIYEMVVQVLDSLQIDLPSDTLLCGEFLELLVESSHAADFYWFADAQYGVPIAQGNPLTLTLNTDTILHLVVQDAGGCVQQDSMVVSLSQSPLDAGFSFLPLSCRDSFQVAFVDQSADSSGVGINEWSWNWGDGSQTLDTLGLGTYQHVYGASGNYTVTLAVQNSDGCNDAVQVPLSVRIPTIEWYDDTVRICPGQSVELVQAFDTSFVYQWSPTDGLSDPSVPNPVASPNQSTAYVVEVSVALGDSTCTVPFGVSVLVEPLPTFPNGAAVEVCPGTVSLTANAIGAVGVSWSSEPDLDPVVFASPADSAFIFWAAEDMVWYVSAANALGCAISDTVLVSVWETEIAGLPVSGICLGDTAVLEAQNLSPWPVVVWDWSPVDDILVGQGTPTVVVVPGEDRLFQVIGQHPAGCRDTAFIAVDVFETLPTALASADPEEPYLGQPVQLSSPALGGYAYSWSPTDALDDPSVSNPLALPAEPTWFSVTVTDINGCTASSTVWVPLRELICDDPYIFVPNAFTPNGDGENDQLFVRSNILSELYFAVYDRWGELVFETTDLDLGWDGTFRGQALPPDAFGWYLKAKCYNGQEFFQKGNVTLLR